MSSGHQHFGGAKFISSQNLVCSEVSIKGTEADFHRTRGGNGLSSQHLSEESNCQDETKDTNLEAEWKAYGQLLPSQSNKGFTLSAH